MTHQRASRSLVFETLRRKPNTLRCRKLVINNTVCPQHFRHQIRRIQGPSFASIHLIHQDFTLGQIAPKKKTRSQQNRRMSSWITPELVQDLSMWGGTGVALTSIHNMGLPYWSCFAFMNFTLRASLLPLVVCGAHTASRYAKVAPEIQFIVTLFRNDLKSMRAEGKSLFEQRQLFLQNLQTVRSIYKLHSINPLTVFFSPFLQIPFFYYVATDLRKIVNGSDPALAQELTESGVLWVPDLTDPDPWFGLPVAAGMMLYVNVEVAIGKRSLGGPATSQSDFAGMLKDLFQTVAVFMPCFASQSPAGLQIYLVSSFTWTLFQSAALRDDTIREWLRLPPMGTPPTEPKFAKEFMEFKKLEQKAKEIRGDGPVLGRNVLAVGFETSFPGTNRPSTIHGSGLVHPAIESEKKVNNSKTALPKIPKLTMEQASGAWGGRYIHGISAPRTELEERLMMTFREDHVNDMSSLKLSSTKQSSEISESETRADSSSVNMQRTATLDPKSFKRKKGAMKGKNRYRKNRTKQRR